MTDDQKRQKKYSAIDHLNAAVNIFRKIDLPEAAEKVKEAIREANK